MRLGRSGTTDSINWRDAVVGGACVGGIMWATIAHVALAASEHPPHATMNWAIVAAICIPVAVVGFLVALWSRRGALRTAGGAAVIACLTGPAVILGFLCLIAIFG